MGLRDFLKILLNRLWLIVLGAAVVLLIGMFAISQLGFFDSYTAIATVRIGGDVSEAERDRNYAGLDDEFIDTYADLVSRRPLLQGVINELGLSMTPDELSDSVSAASVPGTQLLEISVTDSDPETAALVANSVGRQLIALTSARVRNFVTFVEEAVPPTESSQDPTLFIVVFVVLGALLTGGLVFLYEFARDAVYNPEELEERTGLSALAIVRPTSLWKRLLQRHTPAWRKANPVVWWPLTQVCQRRFESLGLGNNPHPQTPCVLVASPSGGGESAVAATNLAAAWARSGQKVALVDANPRRPKLHKWFNLSDRPGLWNLLSSPDQVREALQPTNIPGLHVLPAGPMDEAGEVAAALPVLDRILAALSAEADAVVLHGPPLTRSTEGAMLASRAHGVIMALRAGRTRMSDIADAQDTLEMAQSDLWGTVLMEVG